MIRILLFSAALIASAQTPPISYEASIKPSKESRTFSEYQPGGRFTARGMTVSGLFRLAYRVQVFQIVGEPAWFSTQRFDIEAKADMNPAPLQPALLEALLKDRFKLAVHAETREQPVFALTPARSDGKLGPQLVKSDFDCAAYLAGPRQPPTPGRAPTCGLNVRPGSVQGNAVAISQVTPGLAIFVGRFVIDKTGLTGLFNINLQWAADGADGPVDPNSFGASIFTSVQEQLGLKLSSEKARVEVVVIDHLEQPSEN